MKQNELTKGRLLNVVGNLEQAGYAKNLIKDYHRKDIKARQLRIKEWDYYYIGNQKYGIALTIADNSYMGLASVSVLEFETGYWKTKSVMTFMPKGKTNLPETSVIGDCHFKHKKIQIDFINDGKTRRLYCKFDKFDDVLNFECDIELKDIPNESMVIATPFEKKYHFYYNQKINCMRASGKATLGGKTYLFDESDSFAVLDWGRGVWTYKNTWYWSSMSGLVDNVKIGFNLGYGFGDTTAATENMIFYDGLAYKTEQVTFNIPKNEKGKFDYLKPWTITSSDNCVELTFTPVLDRCDNTDVLVIKSLQHQVFGKFSGILRISDKKIVIKDLMGFAERVVNYW